jgi:hypothetical protein
LYDNTPANAPEPKIKKILIPEFRFYKDAKRLKEILDKECESRLDPMLGLGEDEELEKQVLYESGFNNWS